MLNAELATISHIEMTGGSSRISAVISPSDLARVASDLGNRASDLVQSNFIVWVEGPSDRLWIRAWLAVLDPLLIEGAHFSIMFYGGALLSHLTAEDEEVGDFIELLKINRNLAVVIDSDKSSEDDNLNATKQRVISELRTEGYTIENYVAKSALENAVRSLYPSKTYNFPNGQWKSPLGKKFQDSSSLPSKTTVARSVIDAGISVDSFSTHLTQNLSDISQAIRAANGLQGLDV
jgi:hypothetical protein